MFKLYLVFVREHAEKAELCYKDHPIDRDRQVPAVFESKLGAEQFLRQLAESHSFAKYEIKEVDFGEAEGEKS